MKRTHIYLTDLQGACGDQVKLFSATFGDSAKLTKTNWAKAQKVGLDVRWLVQLLSPDKRADYNAKHAPLLADYNAKHAPLLADYDTKHAPLLADYDTKHAPLLADYRAKYAALIFALLTEETP